MGVDLALLPYYGNSDEFNNFSHTVLQCNRNRDLFEMIEDVPSLDVDDGFCSYLSRDDKNEESHYGVTVETAYGNRLKYTQAKHLKPLIIDGPVGAYIQALDDNHRVALYWH